MDVDRRADLFSFGVVLYEMVTGERPFAGTSTMAVLDAILHDPPRVIHDGAVSGRLKAIITKLIEKDAARRYTSAGEVLLELRALEARPRRSRTDSIAMGAVVVAALLLATWLWRGWSRERWTRTVVSPRLPG